MHDTQSIVKSKLEISKKRLADAFNKLEAVLEQKTTIQHKAQADIHEINKLQEMISLINAENNRLSGTIQQLKDKCNNMQTVSVEALEELNNSIGAIELVLNK